MVKMLGFFQRKKEKVVVGELENTPLDDFERARTRYEEGMRERKKWMETMENEGWTSNKVKKGREIEDPGGIWRKREIVRRLDSLGYPPPPGKGSDGEESEEVESEGTQETETAVELEVEKEKLAELYENLTSNFEQLRTTQTLPECLQGMNGQNVVDFLNDILDHGDVPPPPNERKRALHILCKLAKTAQAYPKAFELTGVDCDLRNPIFEGGFGQIHKGAFRGETICVKAVRAYRRVNAQYLRAQAGELMLGTHLLHPNVLPIYGAFISNEEMPRICIVSSWMEGGTLVDHLQKHPDTPRVPLVSDILSGLKHMHEMEIVHADLKGSNVLISGAQRAVLADFGVSRINMAGFGTTTAADAFGTARWKAPELHNNTETTPATLASDIWAIGCIFYEILTREIPFHEYKSDFHVISAFVFGKAKLTLPEPSITIPYANEIWSLAEQCLRHDPLERPSAHAALDIILDLNVKDDRPPASVDTKMFIKKYRGTSKTEYNALVSIVQQIQENNDDPSASTPDLPII